MAGDYIPSNQALFDDWFKNILDYVTAKTKPPNPAWDKIDKSDVEKLKKAYQDWSEHYKPTLAPHTPGQTTARNEARRRAELDLRNFVQRILKWPPVTDDDRAKMYLTIHDNATPDGVPTAQAKGDLVLPDNHKVEIMNIRPVGFVPGYIRAKYSVRIHYGIFAPTGSNLPTDREKHLIFTVPKTGDDLLLNSILTHKKRHLFDFPGCSKMAIFICMRFENSKGEAGPFGPMLEAVIP